MLCGYCVVDALYWTVAEMVQYIPIGIEYFQEGRRGPTRVSVVVESDESNGVDVARCVYLV